MATLEPVPVQPRSNWLGQLGMLLLGVLLGAGGMVALQHKAPQPVAAAAAHQPHFHCPMHPSYTSDHPGDCPICGMKLVPVGKETAAPKSAGGALGMAALQISPERQQLLGVRTAPATIGPVARTWTLTARVAADERKVRRVTLKVEGFVESLSGAVVGQVVRKGQPLLTIYSPEVLGAQNEYLLAVQTDRATGGAADLGRAARKRLELLDVPKSILDGVARGGHAQRTFTIASPIDGVVTAASAVQGARVVPGDVLFEVSDLRKVWLLADARASDLGGLQRGMSASATLTALPGRTLNGTVDFIDPTVNPKTRTLGVRIAVDNADGTLRPDLFGEVMLHEPERDGLRIPADAVIDSGSVQVVFLSLAGGHLEPRKVQVGVRVGDDVEVLSGLHAGDLVVTRANFLVDSESRLQSALRALDGSQP